jgi:peptidoglycan/xylan/chitin deacetylase (PgdA/CDA1 family)
MRYVFFTVSLVLIVSACVSSSSGGEVSLAKWPYGHKSAVAITFETEIPSKVQLSSIARVLRGRGLNATFFVIAGYFQENPGALEEIRSFEVGNLAWMQRSWRGADVTREFQQEEITKADAWLRKMGFAPTGYRAPFLKVNEDTYPILESLGYTYDASQWFGFHPYRVGGIIEIPLSLNYDLYWSDLSMSHSMVPTYLAFEESYNDDGLFTFYAHTNKVYLNMNNFTRFLDYAGARNVWFASTGEVADWWSERKDLSLSVDGSRVTVTNKGVRAVSGATLLLKAGKTLKGAKEIKQRNGVTYAVLPELGPNSKIIMVLEK